MVLGELDWYMQKNETRKKYPIYYSNKKNKVSRNKPNQRRKRPVFRKLKKEIKEDTNKWKHIPCTWIARINIIKMSILPKATYGLHSMQSLLKYQ